MKRVGILFLVLIALVAMTAADVAAQPKVTITGLVDNVTSYTKNLSIIDANVARNGDTEWYARTRVRPDITAEVGTTKFVLGIEIDATWGQTGATDVTAPNRFGNSHSWDLNTDALGPLEVKWAYTEFGMPIMPVPTVFRLGAQPWQAQYKLAALANGDFAGVHVTNQWTPGIKSNFTWASIEEESTGARDGFIRGEDHAFIVSVEVTPFKGLDIRPIFSYAVFEGVTSGSARTGKGGVTPTSTVFFPLGNHENRFTVGLDARWRFGAFSLDPTVFYQLGNREILTSNQQLDAWFVDIRGGWQAGPLLLELAGIYTTGNDKTDRIETGASRVKFYQPLSTDSSYYATWAEIWALGIDYFNHVHNGQGGLQTGASIGYDKYGLIRFGARSSYALTPAFTVRAAATANWTEEETGGTKEVITIAAGRTINNAAVSRAQMNAHDGSSYLGTEINLGFQWRFVPNVALDAVYSYMWSGNAMAAHTATGSAGGASNARNPQDVQAITARVRYTW